MIDINYHSVRTKSIVFLVLLLGVQSQVIPSMLDSIKRPVHVQEGDDALLTCVVRGAGDRVVLWKKDDRERSERRVLTAGEATTTPDKRFSVLHERGADSKIYSAGGDVWVLVIRDAKPSDSGVYICELNSEPVVRSFHKLNVLPRGLVPPETNKGGDSYSEHFGDIFNGKVHNYTDCCSASNVSTNCLGYCSIQSILDGNTGQEPENCERDFPSIVRCMADRRNHVPCCIQEKVPDICQDVCRGEYTVITDNIKTHFSCTAYTELTLACVVEGIELLPSPPEDVEVEALTEKSLKVSWGFPTANHASVTAYHVMFKTVRSFDAHLIDTSETSSPTQSPETNEVVVPSDKNSTIVGDLIPFTMYEISVTAVNSHGSSLPSYFIRSLTLNPGKAKSGKVADPPKLPDITKCCIDKGVTHASCVDKLCNPITAGQAKVTDLMICAPWAADTFKCLINGKDHTPCCKRRGLPELCQGLCSGNVTTLDFNYFKCLRYMSDYTNCLMQGYGVLPGSPTRVHVTNIATEYAIVHWAAPLTLGDTVQHYNIRYKKFFNDDNEYAFIEKVHPPFILEDLESNTNYEFYVEAVNTHGVGEPSFSLIFQTQSKKVEDEIEKSLTYNVTECCAEVGVSEVCMPLCSYDANMSDIKHLAKICLPDFHKLLRCGAGGRNHEGCCARRGVSAACVPLCTGVIVDSLVATVKNCISFIGNIVQCFEEGTGLLPGPIGELHATKVTDRSITIQWSAPVDGANVTGYIVHYQNKNESNIHETPLKLENQMNVTATVAELKDLEVGGLYSIFVVAVNAHGTSLPSSILIINDTHLDVGDGVNSITSPPHSLAVAEHSATFVTITWQPPEFSHPQEILTYTLYHTSTGKEGFEKVEISVTSHTLEHLSPNTQYIIYVTANSSHGVSLPSETLIAWTDPAYPAFVEPPTVHPINLVMEGSSMTILCIAMGTPMPTISLYISGRLVRQEITRHMVTVIHNVTRDMDQISCYADNGFGTPMQASRKITISHVPTIQASGITMAAPDESVALECRVAALPRPQMAFWRDPDGRVPVIQGPKYDIKVIPDNDDDTKYIMRLTINKISEPEEGDYFCHAENAFGSAVQAVSVRIRNFAASHNVTQCCIEQNVTAGCMDACSFYLDIDAVIDKPECIGDFDKLMKCAADGSDHRTCCAGWGVPRRCLDWCRGEPLLSTRVCVLTYTRQIVGCFHEGREKLPGPPQNVHLSTVDSHSVKISWDPPVKNPHTVKVYRVFWRASGDKTPDKIDTIDTELTLTDLKEGISYECVVKAGNRLGTSTLTEPIKFTMGDKFITSTSSVDNDSSNTGVAVGIAMACIFVAAILILSVWLIRNKKGTITWNQFIRNTKMLGFKSQGGVAFENPSYLKETNSEPAVNNESQNISQDASATPKIVGIPSVSGGTGWRQESLQVPQEVNPTLYEELKLGHDGAGFKRLKP